MDLQLVKMSEKYKSQLFDMMDEWTKTGETIIPWAIRKADYHDFDAYLKSLEESEPKEGYVPASTFFAYDRERDILVGYNEICEFTFDDEKTGHGYYYQANRDAAE